MIWKSDLKTLREFAVGIKRDKEAVQNAMDIYLNNGVLERTVNKTKAIKRQMFNRANITLLVNKLISLNTWTAPKVTKIQVFPISSVTVSLIPFYQLIFNLFYSWYMPVFSITTLSLPYHWQFDRKTGITFIYNCI